MRIVCIDKEKNSLFHIRVHKKKQTIREKKKNRWKHRYMLQLIENLLFENTDITFSFIFMAKERKQ